MEGILWKWTNYWNGWQTRWFILENGVLSYYKSQEEVNQGCKGSMKVQACEINVSPIDHTRMDLVIPGEQHMYLRAATSQERQQWLVALGTAKACVQNKEGKENIKNPDALKTKKSELKLYCDLLMQQVHVIKNSAQGSGGPEIENMDEATRLLGVTCDTFIKTLDECMKLSATAVYEMPISSEVILPPVTNKKVWDPLLTRLTLLVAIINQNISLSGVFFTVLTFDEWLSAQEICTGKPSLKQL